MTENNTKHTPGPWRTDWTHPVHDVDLCVDGVSGLGLGRGGWFISLDATVQSLDAEGVEALDANVSLIAASPYMLKALQEICDASENGVEENAFARIIFNIASKAIAKTKSEKAK